MSFFVVGSGPSGVAAARSLLRKGLPVTMLDVGYQLEAERQEAVSRVAAGLPGSWGQNDLDTLRNQVKVKFGQIPKKLVYGSDYAFRGPTNLAEFSQRGTDLLISHSLGGLSTAWGANVFPLLAQDITDWPIALTDLEPYYRDVFEFVSLSASEDHLSRLFPLYTNRYYPLPLSHQATTLLADMERQRAKLLQIGFEFGQSRLAVRAHPAHGDRGCVRCGLCLYGCPYGLIYCSAHTLPELQRFPNFRYVAGYYLERLEESRHGVTLQTRRTADGEPQKFIADRVFLGCGAVETTKVVLASLDAYERELLVRDSQYFLSPVIRLRASPRVTEEPLHTLSQLAIELIDPTISGRSVHLLVYTYNDFYRRALEPLISVRSVRDGLLSRLSVIQGYLHSEDSPALGLRLERPSTTGPTRVILERRSNSRARPLLRRVLRRVRRAFSIVGGIVVPFMTQFGQPGKSYHVGASLPMRTKPADFESDVFGRPLGFKRVHVVDSACLTSIPSTNITLTAMANAARIADRGVDA